jgi:recombination protein RecT
MTSQNQLTPAQQADQTKAKHAAMNSILHQPGLVKTLVKSLAGSMSPDQFASVAFRIYRTAGPTMLEANPTSFVAALVEAAQLGLSPDPNLQECYLIPRWNKTAKQTLVGFQLGYAGMIKLMVRGGAVESIYPEVVYSGDTFRAKGGTDPGIEHELADPEGRDVVAAYAIAFQKSGRPITRVVWKTDLDKAAARSGKADGTLSSFWRDHFDAMARKTAVRRLYRFVPHSSAASEAFARDQDREDGKDVDPVIEVDVSGWSSAAPSGDSIEALTEGEDR